MATATFKIGMTLSLNGTAYTLADKRPGIGGWWGIAADGTTAAIVATPKRGASLDSSATGRAASLQRTAARISRGTVYMDLLGVDKVKHYRVHAGPSCPDIAGDPATDGPTVWATAYSFLNMDDRTFGRAAATCGCIYGDEVQPEPAPRKESAALTTLKAIAAEAPAPAPESAATAPEPAPVAVEPLRAPKRAPRAARTPKTAPYRFRAPAPQPTPAAPARDVSEILDDINLFMEPGVTAPHAAMAH